MDQFTIRKILQRVVVYLCAVVLCAIGMIALATLLWIIGDMIEGVDKRFSGSQLIVGLISAIAVIGSAVIYRGQPSKIHTIKDNRKNYELLIDDIMHLIKQDEAELHRDMFKQLAEKHLPNMIKSESPSVVNYLYYIMDHYKKDADTLELLFLSEQLLNTARAAMGYKNEVKPGRILSIYRSETDKDLRNRREKLKGKPGWKLY